MEEKLGVSFKHFSGEVEMNGERAEGKEEGDDGSGGVASLLQRLEAERLLMDKKLDGMKEYPTLSIPFHLSYVLFPYYFYIFIFLYFYVLFILFILFDSYPRRTKSSHRN